MAKSKNRRKNGKVVSGKNPGSNIIRSKDRVKKTCEVFTPPELVNEMLDKLGDSYIDPSKTCLDPTCGSGNFLVAIKERRMAAGVSEKDAIATLYGADLMPDNVAETRSRLDPDNKYPEVMEKNIICVDALRHHFRFDGTHPYDDEIYLGVVLIGKRAEPLTLKDCFDADKLMKIQKRKMFLFPMVTFPYEVETYHNMYETIVDTVIANPNECQKYSGAFLANAGASILKMAREAVEV